MSKLSNVFKAGMLGITLLALTLPLNSRACDESTAVITNILDLGGGVSRYTIETCIEYLGLEGAPYEFGFDVVGATVVAFTPSTVSTSSGDIYTGAISGGDISWATGSVFPAHGSSVLCYTATVDISGSPTSIVAQTHFGRPEPACNFEIYTSTPPPADLGCGDVFTDSGGAGGPYGSNANESWLICGNTNEVTTVTFTAFDVEGLTFDYMIVYDGLDDTAPVLGLFDCCDDGSAIPGPVVSSNAAGCLYFTFVSDGTVQEDGWEATVSCTTTSCDASPTLSWE